MREEGGVLLAGTVRDSTGMSRGGVRVRLSGTSYEAGVDASGRFEFGRVPPGRYTIALVDSGYARSGVVAAQREIALGQEDEATVGLRAADMNGLVGPMCGEGAVADDRGAMRVVGWTGPPEIPSGVPRYGSSGRSTGCLRQAGWPCGWCAR